MVRAHRSILERAGLASGLLNEEQIDQAWHVLAENSHADDLSLEEISDRQLASQLIELGHLNRWQAEQLCQGRTKFTLGNYLITDAIGKGGMGWVFLGEHELLGRLEAIKVLPKNQNNAASIESFRREIRAQAQLDHPNLVRISYADQDGDVFFLVNEYVPGVDLRRLVHEHGPLSPEQAAVVVFQAAEALEYAHSQGLIHRDVKPGNLLITPEGHTKLADLGLAYFSEEVSAEPFQSKPKHIVGTADFLAPEIIVTPGEVLPISDIYSLGCTLYYAVTGKVPFPGGKTADKLRRHLDESPIAPQRLNQHVDNEMVRIVNAMMQKRPADRVPSAAEVLRLLRPWVERATVQVKHEIGNLAKAPSKQEFQQAALADTKPIRADSIETDQPQWRMPPPPGAAQVGEDERASSAENSASIQPVGQSRDTLDRVTAGVIVLAAAAVLVTIYVVFFLG